MRKLWIGLIILLTACGGESMAVPKADALRCTVAYRSSIQVGIEREEQVEFATSDGQQRLVFDEATFHAAYDAGGPDNERSLRVWISNSDESIIYQTHLYQFAVDSGPQNQFVGGHGFTGLNYSYPADSSAELQFWCEVPAS